MKRLLVGVILLINATTPFALGMIDANILLSINDNNTVKPSKKFANKTYPVTIGGKMLNGERANLHSVASTYPPIVTGYKKTIPVLIFLNSKADSQEILEFLHNIGGVKATQLSFMPVIAAVIPKNKTVLKRIAEHVAVAQISSNHAGSEELEMSAQSLLLTPSPTHPNLNNWWDQGYTGSHGVPGLIDSGVAVNHLSLSKKKIIVRKEPESGYSDYVEGIRSAHGTGVACIYAGTGSSSFPRDVGIAYGAKTIVSGLAGEGVGEDKDLWQTLTTMDWMLTRSLVKPTVINYSFGNGMINCPSCPDWSGLAKTVDYVINHEKILWVKSAGNKGYIEPKSEAPYASSMTVPADNYNGITVANMNPTMIQDGIATQSSDRNLHTIAYSSSRGPTINGRKKPDLSAPGNDTWTCAPDPEQYSFLYTDAMHYLNGYRLMGGTSSAAPHVGAAILLMQDAGITSPIMEKALLLNSADAWTDSNLPGPRESNRTDKNGHYAVMGSLWNKVYGWGYMNLQKAFDERNNLIEDKLTPENSVKEYRLTLPIGGKVTLVHERRVGYLKDNTEWKLSRLSLELYDANTNQLIMKDDSPIDNVHQVANCDRKLEEQICSDSTKEIEAIVRVKLLSTIIDGSVDEPFALAATTPFL